MTTEQQCRNICREMGAPPDAPAPKIWQDIPKPPEAKGGTVLMWMTWITTVERPKSTVKDSFTVEMETSKAKLQAMIDDTAKPKYSCYKDK